MHLDLTHVASNCPQSPKKKLYQECLRVDIAQLTKVASPLEILKMPELLSSYYNQDKIQGPQYHQQAHVAHIINQVIFYESLRNFTLRRDSVDFFQITMLPFIRWYLYQGLEKSKKSSTETLKSIPIDTLSVIEKRYIDKFKKLNISRL